MIDTNKLRRLAQAAMHPVTKGRWMRLFGERTVYDRMEDGCRGIPVVSTPVSPPHPFEAACLDFIAAANPAVVIEILDRLEAAESECLEQARLNGMGSEREAALMAKLKAAEKSDAESIAMFRKARDERDALRTENAGLVDDMNLLRNNNTALRAKIAEMEQQAPVMWANSSNINSSRINKERGGSGDQHTCSETQTAYHHAPLYALPGAKGE